MKPTDLPSTPGVYLITNMISGNHYVGSAVNMYKRQQDHLNKLSHGTHCNKHLQCAYALYGKDVFVFNVLEHVPNTHDLIPLEQQYIDKIAPEYNLNPLACSPLGYKHSPETRAKVSEAMKGRPVSKETRAKHRAMKLGKPHSELRRTRIREAMAREEVKMKQSLASKGRRMSERTRKKLSKPRSEETKTKMREAWKLRKDRKLSS